MVSESIDTKFIILFFSVFIVLIFNFWNNVSKIVFLIICSVLVINEHFVIRIIREKWSQEFFKQEHYNSKISFRKMNYLIKTTEEWNNWMIENISILKNEYTSCSEKLVEYKTVWSEQSFPLHLINGRLLMDTARRVNFPLSRIFLQI